MAASQAMKALLVLAVSLKSTRRPNCTTLNLAEEMKILGIIFLIVLQTFQLSGQEGNFETEADYELFEAKKFFRTHYKKEKHDIFKGKIEIKSETTIQFDNIKLEIIDIPKDFLPIFTQGILSPWAKGLTISNLEELIDFTKSPQKKRFKFLLWKQGFANPAVYFLELTNKKIKSKVELKTFFDGAKLTFFKQGWLQI